MIKKLLTVLSLLVSTSILYAQSREPHIGYVYPAGAQKGTSVKVIIGGMNLQKIEKGVVSGNGVEVKNIEYFKPFSRLPNDAKREIAAILKAVNYKQDPVEASKKSSEKILQRLRKQKALEDANKLKEDATKADAVTEKKRDTDKKSSSLLYRPSLDEQLKIVPGERLIYINMTPEEVVEKIKALSPIEFQCFSKAILSKKSVLQATPALDQIVIADISVAKNAKPGIRELRLISKSGESNPLVFVVGNLPEISNSIYRIDKKNPPVDITVPVLLNGEIMPGEVDKFRFKATAGTHYCFKVMGRRLIPFLGDAVPGWFQPVISVHDSDGKMLAYADDNLFDPDPVLGFVPSADGEYELRIYDSIYRGREDFVYRIKVTEGDVPEMKQRPVKLDEKMPASDEKEPDNTLQSAQEISFPRVVSGRIDAPGDTDVFAFNAKKGCQFVAEIIGRRVNSPVDSKIYLLDADGKVLAWNDDFEWPNIGLKTHHSDSYISFEIPEDGRYYIKVEDAQNKGGEEFNYHLRLDRRHPDFRIYVNPSVVNVNAGLNYPVTLTLLRKDGFNGPVTVRVGHAPKGVKLTGDPVIRPGTTKTRMTLSVSSTVKPGTYTAALTASGKAGNREIVHKAIPAEDVMQAFLWRHLVPAEKFTLDIPKKGWNPFKTAVKKIDIKPGETFELVWQNAAYKSKQKSKAKFSFELDSPPKGLSIIKNRSEGNNYIVELAAAKDAKPWHGNIIFKCFVERMNKSSKKTSRSLGGYLPAVPLTITENN